jgi:acyl-CoA synthetase (NDP forming)
MADVGAESGLEFPDLTEATKDELKKIMPPFASIANPMDVTAEAVARPELLRQAAEVILTDPNVDNLVVFYGIVPGAHERLAKDMAQLAAGTDKLVMVTWFPLPAPDIWKGLARAGVPVFSEPVRGIRALGKMVRFVEARNRILSRRQVPEEKHHAAIQPGVDKIIDDARNRNRKVLTEFQAKQLFKSCGLAVPRGGLARTAAEAKMLAAEIGRPVALKAASPDVPHKSDAGVIRLNVGSQANVERAFDDIVAQVKRWNSAARLDGILVEEMITADTREVIIGARQDLRFGPVVTFGLGGIFVEAVADFSLWPAPLMMDDAREMIRNIRGYRILTGFRGRAAADIDAMAEALCRVGEIASQWRHEVAEIEINPLFVFPAGSGVIVGDALAVLK